MTDATPMEDVTLDLSTGENYLFPKNGCKDCLGRGWIRFLPPNKVETTLVSRGNRKRLVKQHNHPLETKPCGCLTKVLRKECSKNPESSFKNGSFKEIMDIETNRQILVIEEYKKKPVKDEKVSEDI